MAVISAATNYLGLVGGARVNLVPDVNAITAAQIATVAADVAVLVADGATPTQAHVNTLNTDWIALDANAGVAPAGVTVIVDTVKCPTATQLRAALRKLEAVLGGSLTP